jgi:S1-C subfamily serine protease
VDDLIQKGKVVRPWIGIGYLPVDDAVREYFGLPASTKGIAIVDVYPDSAASKAGLRVGDVVIEVNRKPIEDAEQFREAIKGLKPGDTLFFIVLREGRERLVKIVVGEMPRS